MPQPFTDAPMPPYAAPRLRRFARNVLPSLHGATDGAAMMRLVERLVASDRFNSFDRFHETTATLTDAYEQAGAQVEVHGVQTGGRLGSGRWVIQEAGDVRSARLEMLKPERRCVADYRDNPWHAVQWTAATPRAGLRGELTILDDMEQIKRLRPGRLRGRFVLTRLDPWHALKPLADAGAAAVITDRAVPHHSDAVAWSKLGWGGIRIELGPTRLVGFGISHNQGQALRRTHEAHGHVSLFARVDARRYAGTHDVISGVVQGRDDAQDEVWAIAHTAEPGALDNASGVAACVEIARIIEALIADGTLPRPRRSIRLVNAYECYGFFAYLEQVKRFQPPLAGVNLDTVGGRADVCDGLLNWHATIPMSASFVDRVGEVLVRSALRLNDTGHRYRARPFVSTCDTLIGDPKYGFPCPWLNTHLKRRGHFDAYHSSADTIELIDPRAMRTQVAAMAGYLYALADAGADELLELADAETRHFTAQIERAAEGEKRYHQDQHRASLDRLERWMWSGDRAAILDRLDACRQRVAQAGDERTSNAMPRPATHPATSLARAVPRRTAPLTPTLENTPGHIADRIRTTRLRDWALYWADGIRTVAQITDALRVEYARDVEVEQVAAFLQAHEELGYVQLIHPRQMTTCARLVRDLRGLGMVKGMDVMVHSSLSRIGHVRGGADAGNGRQSGADAVVDALLTCVGRSGTLLAPSFNHRFTDLYNPRTTPTTNGAIADALWRRRDAVRSDHPTHAVAAIGARAEHYTRDHTAGGIWSPASPIGRLVHEGGYILSLGVTHAATTAMHVAEVAVPCRCIDQFAERDRVVADDGSIAAVPSLAWRDGHCPVTGRDLDDDLRRHGAQRRGRVGDADATFVEAAAVYRTRISQLRHICPTCAIRPKLR
ncbi:MAG: AAC(3) family N-acetyltransferase [Phycisphaeraceae bacterium]